MAKKTPQGEEKAPSFEAALAELEKLVASMEGGELSLEASLAAYKRGMELVRFCQQQLADAEQQVRILSETTSDAGSVPEAFGPSLEIPSSGESSR